MTTYANMTTSVRIRLDEAVARRFSDSAQLVPYISQGERRLAGILSRIPKGHRFRAIHESFTITADATTFALTSLGASVREFDWLIAVSIVVANLEVPVLTFEENEQPFLRNMILSGGSPISRVDLQDDNLVILPSFGSARTGYASYGWIPVVKTTGNLETPVKYDDMVRDWAVWYANADAGMANREQEAQLLVREEEIVDLERSRRGISNESVVQRGHTFSRCR